MEQIGEFTKAQLKEDIAAIQALLDNPTGQCCGKVVHRYKNQFDAVATHAVSLILTLVEVDDESSDNNWIDWIEHYLYS
ncbi:hypothetical protein F4Z98_05905 [Candidatus Poribacteria bacterium]|nr:hypothetical protein [Candidatus Poribacteria bacterium]MYB01787.1 hypothetical protein [Candidatus Poribacteria bacterium]MYI34838.1 hypothetical protein [Acidimicrobiaceae bacterium]